MHYTTTRRVDQVRAESVRIPRTTFTRSDDNMAPAVPRNIREHPLELSPMINVKGDRPVDPILEQDPYDSLMDALGGLH